MCEESIQLARRSASSLREVDRLPALLAIGLHEQLLGRDCFAAEHTGKQRLQLAAARLAHHLADAPPGQLLAAFRQPFLVVAVEEPEAVLAVDVGDPRRHIIHDQPELGFARAQRLLRLLQAMDVVHQHERAGDLALRAHVGHDADGHPASHAIGARHEPVEGGRFAAQCTRQHDLCALVDAVADDIAQAQLGDLLGGQPEVMQEGAIDVLTALVAIDVGHRRRHAVHDRAQLRFARRQGILGLFQVGDVMADDVIALDRSVEPEIGNDAVA
jgi:hypothetical protein